MRKEFKSKISLNVQPIVAAGDRGEGSLAFGTQLSKFAEGLQAENAIKLEKKGAEAGTKAGVDPNFKLRDDESQVFNAAFNIAGEKAYLAKFEQDSRVMIDEIERANFNDPIKAKEQIDAYIQSTLPAVDPKIRIQAEFTLNTLGNAVIKRTADTAHSIQQERQTATILNNTERLIDTLYDDITTFGRDPGAGAGYVGEQNTQYERIISDWDSLVNTGNMSGAQYNEKVSDLKNGMLQAQGNYEIIHMVLDGKTPDEINQYIQDVARGNAIIVKGVDTGRAKVISAAMESTYTQLVHADDILAARQASARTHAATTMSQQINTNMVATTRDLEIAYLTDNIPAINLWKKHIFDSITKLQRMYPEESASLWEAPERQAWKLLNRLDGEHNQSREDQLVIQRSQNQISSAPADSFTRGAYNREFRRLLELGISGDDGGINLSETGWNQKDVNEVTNFIKGAAYIPEALQGILSNPNMPGEIVRKIAKMLGPLLSPEYMDSTAILASLPEESAEFWQMAAEASHFGGGLSPEDIKMFQAGVSGVTPEQKMQTVVELHGDEALPDETLYQQFQRVVAELPGLDDSDAAGQINIMEYVSMKNLIDGQGWFGAVSDIFDFGVNVFDAFISGNLIEDELPPNAEAHFESLLGREIMRSNGTEKGLKMARKRAYARWVESGLWAVSFVGGKGRMMRDSPEQTNHPDFMNIPDGMTFAKTIIFESRLTDALQSYIDDGIFDRGADPGPFNALDALYDGTLIMHSLGNGDYGFEYNNQGIVRDLSILGDDGMSTPFTFNYAEFVDSGNQDGSFDPKFQNMIREAAEYAKAYGVTPFDKSLIFQELYYRALDEDRQTKTPRGPSFLTRIARGARYEINQIKSAYKSISLQPELPEPQDQISLELQLRNDRNRKIKAQQATAFAKPKTVQ